MITLVTVVQMVLLGLLAMGVAVLLAQRLSRRIKNALQGYEPEAFARRFHQREDILDALEEGILAIDKDETIIFFNAAAARLLSLPSDAVGRPLRTVYPVSTLGRILHTGKPEYNVSMKSLPDVRVLSDRLPIYENGQLAGAVGIFRNRTEVTRLADDLTGYGHMVDAMRAYTHEFMNKLHVILGLLQIGQPERAQQYIMDTTRYPAGGGKPHHAPDPRAFGGRSAGGQNQQSQRAGHPPHPGPGEHPQHRKSLSASGSLYYRAGQSH